MTLAIPGGALSVLLAGTLAVASPVCLAGGVPTLHATPAQRPRLDIGELQVRRDPFWRHINRKQWAVEVCRQRHPPGTEARQRCLRKARKLPSG